MEITKKSLKREGFKWASVLGFSAFIALYVKMLSGDLITLCQFYFAYQGMITGGFFGFRAYEQKHFKSEKK